MKIIVDYFSAPSWYLIEEKKDIKNVQHIQYQDGFRKQVLPYGVTATSRGNLASVASYYGLDEARPERLWGASILQSNGCQESFPWGCSADHSRLVPRIRTSSSCAPSHPKELDTVYREQFYFSVTAKFPDVCDCMLYQVLMNCVAQRRDVKVQSVDRNSLVAAQSGFTYKAKLNYHLTAPSKKNCVLFDRLVFSDLSRFEIER